MPRRFLFGPVNAEFAREKLATFRAAGACLCFDTQPGVDIVVGVSGSWDEVYRQLPPDWQPDYLAVFLQYRLIPAWVWAAPVPVIGVAGDWNLLWHHYRSLCRWCDAIVTDQVGVPLFRSEGVKIAREGMIYGLDASYLDACQSESPDRDIDIAFVGNFHPVIHRERLPWLERVGRLGERWKVRLETSLSRMEICQLLKRTRIAFNRSIRGECNSRVFEAIAAGALLFMEEENREIRDYLAEGEEYVSYNARNLEDKLNYYLEHESERHRIATAGQKRSGICSFGAQWQKIEDVLSGDWETLLDHARQRRVEPPVPSLHHRSNQVAATWIGADPRLLDDLRGALKEFSSGENQYHYGLVQLANEPPDWAQIANAFQAAWHRDPHHVLAGAGLTSALRNLGQREFAIEQAYRTLAMLDGIEPRNRCLQEAMPFTAAFDELRVEWERAAWEQGCNRDFECDSKRTLLRWWLYRALAELTQDLSYALECHRLRPDLTGAFLGLLLAASGRLRDASSILQSALIRNPFEREVAAALHHCLLMTGQFAERESLVARRRILAKSVPRVIPPESWFTEDPILGHTEHRASALRICWQGTIDAVHSLAHVNRELLMRLIRDGHHVSIRPSPSREAESTKFAVPAALAACQGRELDAIDVHVRHHWPPDWRPPESGHWVVIQPWEFGALPREWVEPLKMVDEVWVPSRFVREAFVKSGVPPERVVVIPNGVSQEWIEYPRSEFPLQSTKRFRFLFIGGTLERKGIDLLLKAYGQVFSAADDVCLVVKDMGVNSFYRGQTAEAKIEEFRRRPGAPEIEYLGRDLDVAEMIGLYDSCQCLAHPFRGEGFGLPILEAMARGLPVIVTGYGPTLDYCTSHTAYLLPATPRNFSDNRVGETQTDGRPFLVEVDQDWLRWRLKFVYQNPQAARELGERARQEVRRRWTWDHAVERIHRRLERLVQTPIVRQTIAPSNDERLPTLQPGISLCMIVKNEEKNLGDCLRSVADLVDEMIIVDTGSADRTKQIAREFGARVFEFPWIDDFAAARNESLRRAGREWVFWMDADDRLDAANREAFRRAREQLSAAYFGYVMKCLCLPGGSGVGTVVDHVRIFRNHPEIRWEFRIHEQILPSIRKLRGEVTWTDVVVHHVGYQDAEIKKRKRERDLRLLLRADAEKPDDPFTLFNLGQIHQEEDRLDEALACFRRSLQRSDPHASIVRKLYSLISQILRMQRKPAEALSVCVEGIALYPDDPELAFQEGLAQQQLGNWRAAEASYRRVLDGPKDRFFTSSDPGLRGYKAHHNLGVVLRELGQDAEAETEFRRACEGETDFEPSLTALGELFISQRRWRDFDQVVQRLRGNTSAIPSAETLIGRGYLARRELSEARSVFESLIQRFPSAVPPRVFLSHVFLQSEQWQQAEATLEDILRLDPENSSARRNLEHLRSKSASAPLSEKPSLALHPPEIVEAVRSTPSISLCMIVRNEERHLERCLQSARDLVDEVLITDTGSSDATKSIAARMGARVFDLAWPDSFAVARTNSIRPARGDWIFYLDADEYLDDSARNEFRQLRSNLKDRHVYMMQQVSESSPGSGEVWSTDHARLFPKLNGLQWTYRVHEQVLGFLLQNGCQMAQTGIRVRHTGFAEASAKKQKIERNLRLVLMDLQDYPTSGFVWFNRAACHIDLKEFENASDCLAKAIALTSPKVSFIPKAHALLADTYLRLDRRAEALEAIENALRLFPSNQELLLEHAAVTDRVGRSEEAIVSLNKVLSASIQGASLGFSAETLITKAHHKLAELLRRLRRLPLAEHHARLALERRSDAIPIWTTLARILVETGQIDELKRMISRADANANYQPIASQLQALLAASTEWISKDETTE
jgi:glycosyltransferase involved in cell wall biosynthesis/predicted Zn-dependent protease